MTNELTQQEKHVSFWKSRPLQFNILFGVVTLLIATVGIILSYTYFNHSRVVAGMADDLISKVQDAVVFKTVQYLIPAAKIVEIAPEIYNSDALASGEISSLERFAMQVLTEYPQLSSFYVGDRFGNFLMVRRIDDGLFSTKYIRRSGGTLTAREYIRNSVGQIMGENILQDTYDPRTRPWYQQAKASREAHWTDVYVFYTEQTPGITASHPAYDRNGELSGVYGLDIRLEQVSKFLQTQRVGDKGQVVMVTDAGNVVAHSFGNTMVMREGGQYRILRLSDLNADWIQEAFNRYEKTQEPHFSFSYNGETYLASFSRLPGLMKKDWNVAVVVPEKEFLGSVDEINRIGIMISIGILIIALLLSFFLTRSITTPIVFLTSEAERIRQLKFDSTETVHSQTREIQLLSNSISAMKAALSAFKKYVPASLVRQLIESGEEARLGGTKKALTVMFTDIIGFTAIAESLPPEEMMHHLSDYLDSLTDIIRTNSGTVDKYIGDAIMAFWGAPAEDPDQVVHACRTALLCREKVQVLNNQWREEGKPLLATCFGVHTGEAIVGNMGSSDRMNYTAIGDNVNLASRLESINRFYGTSVIVSGETYEEAKEFFIFRPLDFVAVKGRSKGIMIYELMVERGRDGNSGMEALSARFTEGFSLYFSCRWADALNVFKGIAKDYPEDKPAALYVERCTLFLENPPAKDWDKIFRFTKK